VGEDFVVLGYGREETERGCCVDFGEEFCVHGGVGENVDDEGLHGCTCGVCACEQYEEDFGAYVFGIEGIALFVASIDEPSPLPLAFSSS
jgi:hypothetical protein